MTVEKMSNDESREYPNKKYETLRLTFVGAQREDISVSPIELTGLADLMVANVKKNKLDSEGSAPLLIGLLELFNAAKKATSAVAKRDAPTLEHEFNKFALWLDGRNYEKGLSRETEK